MPEVYYSNFKNEVEVLNDISGVQTTIDAKTSRVDVPVLVGYKILKNTLSAFAGPVGSINLVKDDNYDSFKQKVNSKEFTVGYQNWFAKRDLKINHLCKVLRFVLKR